MGEPLWCHRGTDQQTGDQQNDDADGVADADVLPRGLRVRPALLALALSGCSWLPTVEVPVEVKIPVPVARIPPPELLHCTENLPRPVFTDCGESVCLSVPEQARFRSLVDRLLVCDGAWRQWATSP